MPLKNDELNAEMSTRARERGSDRCPEFVNVVLQAAHLTALLVGHRRHGHASRAATPTHRQPSPASSIGQVTISGPAPASSAAIITTNACEQREEPSRTTAGEASGKPLECQRSHRSGVSTEVATDARRDRGRPSATEKQRHGEEQPRL